MARSVLKDERQRWFAFDLKTMPTAAHLWYEDEADGERSGEEGEERGEGVCGVNLVLDHEGRWYADQAQNYDVVNADA